MAKPIPDGAHTITPILNLQGAAEAVDFYERAFGAEEIRRVDMPGRGVGHVALKIGSSQLIIEEAVRNPPTHSAFLLYFEDVDAVWARATAAGASVIAPLSTMFWGDRWGLLGDRWGNRWGLATHVEDVPAEELARRAMAARGGAGNPA